jgi:hypothetical protein
MPNSIRIARFRSPGSLRRMTSPCQSSQPNSPRPPARGLIPPRSRAGSSATAIASKETQLASEQDRPDANRRAKSKRAREERTAKRQPRMRLEPHRLVFPDETGTTTKMTRLRGRCLKGQRLRSKAPFGHWKTRTFVAGPRRHGLTAPFVVDAPMNRRIFETYVETQLAPNRERRCRDHGQSGAPQQRGRGKGHPRRGRMDPVPAALQSGSQSNRDGLFQTQGASASQRGQDNRRPLAGDRTYPRSFEPTECQNDFKAAGYGST